MSIAQNFPALKPSLLLDFANVKALDPRITYSRASEARYYDGKTVAKAEENLRLYSQDFTNAYWGRFGVTSAKDTIVAPDGSTTADTITISSTTEQHFIQPTNEVVTSGTTYTHSIFVKKNNTQYFQFGVSGGGFGTNVWATVDLDAGTIPNNGTSGTYAISAVGNGWYRVSITATATGNVINAANWYAFTNNPAVRLPSYAGNGTDSVYIWGAQWEVRNAVTAYTPTTTQPITNYIPVLQTAAANVARFQHNPITGESEGFWVEEQRTNLVVRSEDFGTTWSNLNSSEQLNVLVAPDGTLTADKLVEDTANGAHAISQSASLTAAAHTASVYIKAGERTFARIILQDATPSFFTAYFNLSAGTVGNISGTGTTATITSVGNGWYRCTVTATTASGSGGVAIRTATANGTDGYTGDGYSGIYIWGAQLEAGEFPTSYIPTVASQVTRSADVASMTGANFSSWYRADEGTVYVEAARSASGDRTIWQIDDGTNINRFTQYAFSSSVRSRTTIAGSQNDIDRTGVTNDTFFKAIYGIQSGSMAAVVNAGTVGTGTNQIPSATMTTLRIGLVFGNTVILNGYIKKLAYYPKRLTNAQLQALTS